MSSLCTSRLVPATSQIGQSFLDTNQTILLLIQKRKIQAEKLVSIRPYVSQSDLRESWLTFKLVTKRYQFFQVPDSTFLRHLRWFRLFQVPVSTQLRLPKDVSLIQVSFVTSLRRATLVIPTQVPVVASLRRLKLGEFICVAMRRLKDLSNRSVSLTYQFRRCYDVSAQSVTSQPIWDLNETSL